MCYLHTFVVSGVFSEPVESVVATVGLWFIALTSHYSLSALCISLSELTHWKRECSGNVFETVSLEKHTLITSSI